MLENINTVPSPSPTHSCRGECRAYYPCQSCSHMCGIIVICMAAVMSLNWDSWSSWNYRSTPPIISEPSQNHKELRIIVMTWIIDDSIQTSYFMEHQMPSNQKLAITTEDSDDDFEPPCKRAKLQVQQDDKEYTCIGICYLCSVT